MYFICKRIGQRILALLNDNFLSREGKKGCQVTSRCKREFPAFLAPLRLNPQCKLRQQLNESLNT